MRGVIIFSLTRLTAEKIESQTTNEKAVIGPFPYGHTECPTIYPILALYKIKQASRYG